VLYTNRFWPELQNLLGKEPIENRGRVREGPDKNQARMPDSFPH
jgi:hypothetical protein